MYVCMVAMYWYIAIRMPMYSYEDIFICKQGSFVKHCELLILSHHAFCMHMLQYVLLLYHSLQIRVFVTR